MGYCGIGSRSNVIWMKEDKFHDYVFKNNAIRLAFSKARIWL